MGNSSSKASSKKKSSSSNAFTSSIRSNAKHTKSTNTVTPDLSSSGSLPQHVPSSNNNVETTPVLNIQPNITRTTTSQSIKSNRTSKSRRSLSSSIAVTPKEKKNLTARTSSNDLNIIPNLKKHLSNIETSTDPNPNPGHHDNDSSNLLNVHRRSHSQHSPLVSNDLNPGSTSSINSINDNSHKSNNDNVSNSSNFLQPRRLSNRRSSFNTTADLPPSMIQMEPKSPILKNSKYQSSSTSFQYYENALTDDENDNNNGASPSYSVHHPAVKSSKHSHHSSRPSSIRNGSSSSRQRRKSDNNHSGNSNASTPDIVITGNSPSQMQPTSRTNSFVSSVHSRKSSMGSNTTTAYSTPLNSPGVMRVNDHNNSTTDTSDYFGNVQQDPSAEGGDTPDQHQQHHSHHYHNHRHTSEHSPFNPDNVNNSSINNGGSNLSNEYSDAQTPARDQYPSHMDSLDNTLVGMNNNNNSALALVDGEIIGKKKKIYKPIDIDETIQKLLDAGYAAKRTKNVSLKNSEIAQICHQAREMFLAQPSLLELSPPVKIVGDVHGQYGDLLRLFTKCGFPPSSNYLFLGDYVDRGKQSLETILLLLCYKIKYPENFFLLRGNHECANVTRVYGFYDECKRRCNIKTWKVFIDTFNTLPLAAIVAGKIFCVHGGLSPVLNSMDEIRHVSRPTDVPDFGLINDLLWSDPTDSPNEWEDNERGVSYCYNKVAINKFLNKFGFDLVCRAHMVVEDGYEFFNDRSLVTVFSAPNYCGEFDNWGAVMSVSEGLLCSFELLDPLDSAALKQVMKKGRQERKVANQQQLQEQLR